MKFAKKILASCLSVLLILSFSSQIFATEITEETSYKIEDLYLEMILQEGTYVFTSSVDDEDPLWEEAGIYDVDDVKDDFFLISPSALITANDGDIRIYVIYAETDTTDYYYNLNYISNNDLNDLADMYNYVDGTDIYISSLYETEDLPFIEVSLEILGDDGILYYEHDYYTIINGYSVTFVQVSTEPIPDENIEFMENIIDNLTFTDKLFSTDNVTNEEVVNAYILTILIGIIVIFIIAFFVIVRRKDKKNKIETETLAKALSKFREEKALNKTKIGEVLFENTTEVTDYAIKKYCKYFCYVSKRLSSTLMYLLWLIIIAIMLVTDIGWLFCFAIIFVMVLSIYKFIISGANLEKNLKSSYKKMRTRKAGFHFFENEFTITGIESALSHPYFQITEIKEYQEFIYFYFGANSVYMIDKNNFTKGEAEEFRKFLKDKTGKNFK